jgi:hypothetical protein
MLKKLTAALNPFFTKRADHEAAGNAPGAMPASQPAKHPHSFSCACAACEAETDRLTRERLKAQGA